MSTDAPGSGVTDPSVTGGVNPGSAAGGVTPELRNEIQRMVAGIVRDAVPRAVKAAIGDSLAPIQDALAQKAQPQPQQQSEPGDGADSRPTMKALQDRIAKLEQGIEARDKKLAEADNKTRQMRLQNEVHQSFAKHLGADSPHLGPYVAHYLGQFVDQDGRSMRKVLDEYGTEKFVPLEDAVGELFKGELKHLVQHSKADKLPQPHPGLRGAFRAPQQNGATAPQGRVSPFVAQFAQQYADQGDDGMAQGLMSAATLPPAK